jgi:hypothetical protein
VTESIDCGVTAPFHGQRPRIGPADRDLIDHRQRLLGGPEWPATHVSEPLL